MVKALFIFPPIWTTTSISTGIPQIMGFLEKKGYKNVEALDLNIKFFHYFYKKDKLFKLLEDLKEERANFYKHVESHSKKLQSEYKLEQERLEKIKQHLKYRTEVAILRIEDVVKKYKSGNCTEKRRDFVISQKIFSIVNELIVLRLIEDLSRKPATFLTRIKECEYNQYKEFFSEICDDIIKQNYDYIGFSVNSSAQSLSALILTKMLREKGIKSHICYGGSQSHLLKSVVFDEEEYFNDYMDTLMIGAGEYPTLELFEYLEGKRELKDVSGIIYKNEKGEIKENEVRQILDEVNVISSYNGYDFKEYNLPEKVIPIRTSFGCYWGQCTFCDYNSLTKFEQRSVNSVIEEIKYYIKNYKVNNFYFVDAALSPKFLREFSKRIKEENLEIFYFTNLRFEKDFTKEFLTQLYETGLRCCGWGLESASPRILKLMRKGILIENAERILKDAHELGLINHLYYICGFPTETKKDFDMTFDFIKRNLCYVDSLAKHFFVLEKSSYIYSHPEEFSITQEILDKSEIKKQDTFYSLGELGSLVDMEYYNRKVAELSDEIVRKGYDAYTFDALLVHNKLKE